MGLSALGISSILMDKTTGFYQYILSEIWMGVSVVNNLLLWFPLCLQTVTKQACIYACIIYHTISYNISHHIPYQTYHIPCHITYYAMSWYIAYHAMPCHIAYHVIPLGIPHSMPQHTMQCHATHTEWNECKCKRLQTFLSDINICGRKILSVVFRCGNINSK